MQPVIVSRKMSETRQSSSDIESKLYRVVKTFNFDGLIIEIIEKIDAINRESESEEIEDSNSRNSDIETYHQEKSPSEETDDAFSPSTFICLICLEIIENDDAVILENCQDIFCTLCIAKAIIQNKNDAMLCPSKFSDCDKEISNDEIKAILGDKNYEIYVINKLQRKLESLMEKDETDYDSLYGDIVVDKI